MDEMTMRVESDALSRDDDRQWTNRPVCRGQIHVVREGDTLYKLAKQYDVRLFDIMRLNPYVNVYNLQIGDEICIPTISAEDARQEKTYVVTEGDTISDVLGAFGVDFETLARWNPAMYAIQLTEGMVIKLPLIMPRR